MLNKSQLYIGACLSIILIIFSYTFYLNATPRLKGTYVYKSTRDESSNPVVLDNQIIDFEGYDNNKEPFAEYIVPNFIHLVYLNLNEIKFYQCVNIYSIFLNQKPDRIYIHCDKCDFKGYYWEQLNSIEEIRRILIINRVPDKKTIFGKEFGWIQHRADVVRIMVLMNYGGIYLDNDVYLVNSLDKYRYYEMTVSWDGDKEAIGNQVLIANRNARLLRAYFDSYRTNYTPSEWYYNAGMVPAKILLRDRYLAHAVRITLGTHMLVPQLYHSYWPEWRNLDTIHLLMGHRSYLDKSSPIKEFDQENIKTYNFTYGEMCREILAKIEPYLLNRNVQKT